MAVLVEAAVKVKTVKILEIRVSLLKREASLRSDS